jgi:hypothetical protein
MIHRHSKLMLVAMLLVGHGECPGSGYHQDGKAPARESSGTDARTSNPVLWRSERLCGVNCVYLMLKFYGSQPDYSRVESALLHEDLCTLTDIKHFLYSQDPSFLMARTDPPGLQTLPMPVIAHLDLRSPRGETRGHFVLITGTDADGVSYVDGTTAEPYTRPWKEFKRQWTGYIIYKKKSGHLFWSLFLLATATGWLIAYLMISKNGSDWLAPWRPAGGSGRDPAALGPPVPDHGPPAAFDPPGLAHPPVDGEAPTAPRRAPLARGMEDTGFTLRPPRPAAVVGAAHRVFPVIAGMDLPKCEGFPPGGSSHIM